MKAGADRGTPPGITVRRLVLLWSAVVGLLAASLLSAYLRQGPTELTVDSALAEFRRTTSTTSPTETADPASGVPGPAATNDDASVPRPPGQGGAADAGNPRQAAPASGAPAAPSPGGLPPPAEGVYPQRTQGYESTDALGGSRHDYPAETSVTVRRSGCGVVERWQPLEERYDESELCSQGETVSIFVFRKYNEFFQRSQLQVYNCPGGAKVFDRTQTPGASWTWRCNSDSAQIDSVVTVVGHEVVTVGGQRVEAVRMRYDSKISGSTRGTQLQERLLARDTGYVISVKSDVEVRTQSPFGEVGYEEHFVIESKSMTPRT